MSETIAIFLVDDHTLVRETLRDRLEATPGLKVVGMAGNAGEATEAVLRLEPDVVLMDIDMPGVSAFEAAGTIRRHCPASRIIFLSAFFNDRYIENALSVEAAGYIVKTEHAQAVIDAIHVVMSGQVYFSPEVRSRLIVDAQGVKLTRKPRSRASTLTPREVQVLQYIARGMSRKEIASTMSLSFKTIECHCANLMSKLEIHDRVELTRFAIREGLVEP